MKVFISWSGERSKAVAEALRYWLPKVIQALEPWMSADDIEKGTRWRSGIATELEQSSVGIICLTRENLDSTWIHFEAGALSKQQQDTYVCTLLLGLEHTDVREPLAQFQHTRANKDDLRKLISTINKNLGDGKLSDSELNESFEIWWPKLEERLSNVPASDNKSSTPVRKDREILDEILEIVRVLRRGGSESPRGTRPSRLNLYSTKTWDISEANALYNIWRIAQTNLSRLKSGDGISERRVEELEEFANSLASDESFARGVLDNLKVDSAYYDDLLTITLPNQQRDHENSNP
jgi:TIR domain